MHHTYRVVCTENQQKYPDKTFIDIYSADIGSPNAELTHNMLIEMRKLSNPDVYPVLTGVILTEFEDGSIRLKYEQQGNKFLQMEQTKKRQKLEPEIIKTFKDMKQRGRNKTLDVSFAYMSILYDMHASKEDCISARQANLIEQTERLRKVKERHDDVVYRGQQEKLDPIVMMKARMNRYQGD